MQQLKGILKRALPFFLTFSLGLLIASFFVTIAAPRFGNWKGRNHRSREFKENYRLRMENQRLRDINESMRRQLEDQEVNPQVRVHPAFDSDMVPPPPPMPMVPRPIR